MPILRVAYLWPFIVSFLGGLTGCSSLAISKPFEWPGLDSLHERVKNSDSDSVILVITHAELDAAHRANFDRGADKVLAATNAFVRSPEHIAAVHEGAAAVKNVQYYRVKIPASELPFNWSRVLAELENAPMPNETTVP
jgi:hypothetical protein